MPNLGSTPFGTVSTIPTTSLIHSTSKLFPTVISQHSEELTAVKKSADNVTNDIETLTGYDKINDPPMPFPVERNNPLHADNHYWRNSLYEQGAHYFVSPTPSISLSELSETVCSALANYSQSSIMESVASRWRISRGIRWSP